MFFTLLPLDFSWNFSNVVSLVANGGAGVEPAGMTGTVVDVQPRGELSGSTTLEGEGAWYCQG